MNFGNGESDKGEQKHAQKQKIKIINTFDTQ